MKYFQENNFLKNKKEFNFCSLSENLSTREAVLKRNIIQNSVKIFLLNVIYIEYLQIL